VPRAVYHARVLPVLSAAVSVKTTTTKQKVVTSHTLTVTVSDAGDAVAGATVTAAGHTKKTGGKGIAKIALPGPGTRKGHGQCDGAGLRTTGHDGEAVGLSGRR
jgi:hypothetical protein